MPSYIPPREQNAKPLKDCKDRKYGIFTPLLMEAVPFAGEILGKIPELKFTDYDFNDQKM